MGRSFAMSGNSSKRTSEDGVEKKSSTGDIPGFSPIRISAGNDKEKNSTETSTVGRSIPIEERDTPSPFHTPKSHFTFRNEDVEKNDEPDGRASTVDERRTSTPFQTPKSFTFLTQDIEKGKPANESKFGSCDTAVGAAEGGEKRSLEAHTAGDETEWKRPISDRTWYLTVIGMMLGAMLYGLDTTIAADVQGPILQTLGDLEKLAWVGIGFAMGSVSVILLIGRSYGLFEIKYLLIAFLTIFSIGSAICGAAPSMNALIIGRVVAGVGGAGTYLGALTYVSKFASPKEQPIYNGIIGLCWGGGTILGPIVGGGFSQTSATWRWAFYINLPLTAVVSPIFIFLYPKYNPMPETPNWEKFKSIDWVGAVLNATVFTLFQVVLTFAGSMYTWDSAAIITLWSVFGVALVAYAIQQTFCIFTTVDRRIFPVQFLKSRTMILLFTGTAASTTGLAVAIFYTPLFFQFTRGDNAIQAAVRLLPLICLYVFSLIVSSASLPSWGRYQPLYIVGGVLLIIGGAMMHTVNVSTSKSNIYGYEVLIAIGAGMINQTGYSVGVVKVKSHEVASALGYMNVAQIGTAAMALSIADCIFQNIGFINVRDSLSGYGFTDDQVRNALAGSQSAILSGGNPAVIGLVVTAVTTVISKIWLMVVAAGAVSLVGGIFMKPEKLKLDLVSGG